MKAKFLTSSIIVFTLFISQLNAQEISVFSGLWGSEYYQDSNRIDKEQLMSLLKTNPQALNLWKGSNTYKTLAYAAITVETGFAIWTVDRLRKKESSLGPTIGTLGSAMAVIVFAVIMNKKKKEAILRYNQGLDKKTAFRLEPSSHGFGIVLSF